MIPHELIEQEPDRVSRPCSAPPYPDRQSGGDIAMADALHADLVLEGGGVKGIALAGAVAVLLEHGYAIHKVGGTSAGAVVGSLVAAGYDGQQLHDHMASVDYR